MSQQKENKYSEPILLQVASSSNSTSLAGAIASEIRANMYCNLQAVGAGAVNQTVKAIAIARGYVAPLGHDLICIPSFADIVIDGEEKTAMKFLIEVRNPNNK
jgi:stage V sporulation protein S